MSDLLEPTDPSLLRIPPPGIAPPATSGVADLLGIEVRICGSHVHLRFSGELDLATGPMLRQKWNTVTVVGHGVLVDVAGLTFVGAFGLSLLLEIAHRAHADGRTFALSGPSPTLRRLLDIAGLTTQLTARSAAETGI
jgi:anti-anti-sigma factor